MSLYSRLRKYRPWGVTAKWSWCADCDVCEGLQGVRGSGEAMAGVYSLPPSSPAKGTGCQLMIQVPGSPSPLTANEMQNMKVSVPMPMAYGTV